MTSRSTFAPFLIPLVISIGSASAASTTQIERSYLGEETAQKARGPEASSISEFALEPLAPTLSVPEWLILSADRLSSFLELEDGWKGLDSLAPREQTVVEAIDLLWQLTAEVAGLPQPSLSADEDGGICAHWRVPGVLATITVYGDGTYSFYAEAGSAQTRSDSEEVGLPLPVALTSILAAGSSAG